MGSMKRKKVMERENREIENKDIFVKIINKRKFLSVLTRKKWCALLEISLFWDGSRKGNSELAHLLI